MKNNSLLLLIILAIGLAGFLGVDFIVYIGYVMIGIFLLSRFLTPRGLAKLEIERRFNPNAFLGEDVPVSIKITNHNHAPMPWLQVQELTPVALSAGTNVDEAIDLGRGDSAELTYRVRAMKRGYYRIGPMRLETGDIFGFREDKGQYPADFITVYPRILPIEKLRLPSRLPFGTIASRQRLFTDPARPSGVRSFRSGDSLRQINWKVSGRYANAANGGLMVKTLEPAISLDTLLLLDIDREAFEQKQFHDGSEWAVEVAASLAAHLLEQRQSVGLATNGFDPLAAGQKFDDSGRLSEVGNATPSDETTTIQQSNFIPPHGGRRHLMSLLELLARVEGKPSPLPFAEFATQATLNLSWGTTIIVITPRADDGLTDTLHRLRRSGYNPVLLCIQSVRDFGRIQSRATRLGFQAFHVLREADLSLQSG